jgi:uncharacterized membrane protein
LLYFFNVVNVPTMKALDAATKGKVVPVLMPRALAWFRFAALATFLFGVYLMFAPSVYPGGASSWDWKILGGVTLGTIMFLNVWGLIWPNQKKVLNLYQYAQNPVGDAEKNKARRTAFLASRVNTMLSLPMLFFMVASGGLFRRAMFGG